MCFCGSLCKLMGSKVLGDDFNMRLFMCDNYEYDLPKRYGKDKPKVPPRTIWFAPSEYSKLNLTRFGNRVHHLFVISYSGWIRSNPWKLSNTLSAKQGGLRKGGSKCCTRKKWRRSARKIKKRSRRGLQMWNIGKRRSVKLIGRESERGPAMRRRRGLRLLGRRSILGALSRSVSFNVRISYSLRHVRSSSSTRLPCSMHMPLQFVVFR